MSSGESKGRAAVASFQQGIEWNREILVVEFEALILQTQLSSLSRGATTIHHVLW